MLSPVDHYFAGLQEPAKGYMGYLRNYILRFDGDIRETWKYRMPVYCYEGKMLCYLWTQKKNGFPYIGFVDGNKMADPSLLQENRSRMKIFIMDPLADVPVPQLDQFLNAALALRR